ncbi:MAG TPA: DNA polymerase IV [Actinomycetales bacterium]|nr:DNA polymerase IV [Actinomycetales bacterium]
MGVSRGPRSSRVARNWGDDDSGTPVLHVDMDAFFASVEIALRPWLRGKPVIVGRADRGVVVAASYEARPFGVRSAMPMARAMRLCPQAVVIPPTHGRYREISRRVMNLLRDITPDVEAVSIDEAYLNTDGVLKTWGSPVEIARYIRRQVAQEHSITCSVGVAASPIVAKLASTHAKPDGLMLIPASATIEFLHLLPVGAIPGVGPRTQEVLHEWGIHTVEELAHTELPILMRIIGRSQAARLHEIAWHKYEWQIIADRAEKSVGTETTFAVDISDPAQLRRSLLALADRTAARARKAGVVGRVVAVKIRTNDFNTFTRSRTLDSPIDDVASLNRVAQELFSVHAPRLPIRLLGVRLEGLSATATTARQLSFDDLLDERRTRQTDVEKLVDQVRDRFGSKSLGPGTLIERAGRDAEDGQGELS